MTTASLSSFAEEAAADFDRLCSILGGGSLSSKQLAGLLSGSNCSENGQQLLDDLISMCREAEAIASRNPHAVRWTKSKVRILCGLFLPVCCFAKTAVLNSCVSIFWLSSTSLSLRPSKIIISTAMPCGIFTPFIHRTLPVKIRWTPPVL